MRGSPIGLGVSLCIATFAASTGYSAPVTMPGPDGGYDYAAVDPVSHRLYVARTDSVTAYDPAGHRPPASLGSINHGHAALPILGGTALLVTSGADNSVRFLDAQDGHEIGRIGVAAGPDGAVVDAKTGIGYVMNAKAGIVSAIDLATRAVTATVTLKPGLEFPTIAGRTLFVNNEDANEIETVDLAHMRAGPSIALPGCTGPSGLAYDRTTDLLISACDNGVAAIVSVRARRLSALLPIGKGPDAVLLDAPRHRAFIPCGGSGTLDIISLDEPKGPKIAGHIATASGARTGALDEQAAKIYLPIARFEKPAPGARHGAMIAGSFSVLVVNIQ